MVPMALWLLQGTGAQVESILSIFIITANVEPFLLQRLYLSDFSKILPFSPYAVCRCCCGVGNMTSLRRYEAIENFDFFQLPAARQGRLRANCPLLHRRSSGIRSCRRFYGSERLRGPSIA